MYSINADFASGILHIIIYVYHRWRLSRWIPSLFESGTPTWPPINTERRERAHAAQRRHLRTQPPGGPLLQPSSETPLGTSRFGTFGQSPNVPWLLEAAAPVYSWGAAALQL